MASTIFNKQRANLKLFSPDTSIKDFLNKIETNIIPHGHEKAFKQSLYNGLAMLLIIVCGGTCFAVYLILQPFLKPLLWALICGTVLHPIKKIISNYFKKYVKTMESYSLLIQTIYLPILIIDSGTDFVGTRVHYLWSLQYMFSCLCAVLGTLFIYLYTPSLIFTILNFSSFIYNLFYYFIYLFQHLSVIFLLCIAYASFIIFYPKSYVSKTSESNTETSESNSESNISKSNLISSHQNVSKTAESKPETSQSNIETSESNIKTFESNSNIFYEKIMKLFSIIIWFSISCYMTSYFGLFLQSILLICIQILFLIGFLYEYYYNTKDILQSPLSNSESGDQIKSEKSFIKTNKTLKHRSQSDPYLIDSNVSNTLLTSQTYKQSNSNCIDKDNNDYIHTDELNIDSCVHTSDNYIYWVACFCILAAIIQNLYLLSIFILFEIIYLIKKLCVTSGVWDSFCEYFRKFSFYLKNWFQTKRDIIFPAPLNGIWKLNILWRHWCISLFKDCSDAFASILVILILIFILIFATLFFAIQSYTETFHMIKLGSNIINQTLVHNPELLDFLPDGWEDQFDSVLNNTYTYGRQGLSNMVVSAFKGVHKDKDVLKIEKIVLELWDRIYQAWVISAIDSHSNIMGPKVSSSAVSQSWTTLLDQVQKTPELLNMKTMSVLVNNNMAMLSSGLESVWVLLKANFGLVIQALSTLITLVFESGFTVFNFFINIVVFLSALFYLLSSSGKLYKPVQIITSVSPVYGNKLAVAIETAVHEVLFASFKLVLFYGLWTWLIHSLFGVQLVYIPSAFASLLAAVPVLGPYWACIPGVLDLYLAQGKKFKAISLLIFQILPTFFVDTAIFNEIQGGHPYLTGLSVAGGVFWLGMEGAIIGPLLLCCLFVIVNMSTSIMKQNVEPTPTTEKYG